MKRRAFWQGLAMLVLVGRARADDDVALIGLAKAEGPDQAVPETGVATWYGGRRWQGRQTASGEPFDRHALTAAHRSLPLGTWVRVVNLANGREVHVRINDRGPRGRRFVIDLSEAAAVHLGFRRRGSTPVELHRSERPRAHQNAAPSS